MLEFVYPTVEKFEVVCPYATGVFKRGEACACPARRLDDGRYVDGSQIVACQGDRRALRGRRCYILGIKFDAEELAAAWERKSRKVEREIPLEAEPEVPLARAR